MSDITDKIIAKSSRKGAHEWLPLRVHMEDTFETAKRLWDYWIAPSVKNRLARGCGGIASARQLFIFTAYVHDLGKATPCFQQKILEGFSGDAAIQAREALDAVLDVKLSDGKTLCRKYGHALLSQHIAMNNNVNEAVSSVLAAHHGQAASLEDMEALVGYDEDIYGYHTNQWIDAQHAVLDEALVRAGYASVAELPSPDRPCLVLLAGMVILADWIASNERLFPYIRLNETLPPESSARRADRAWEALALPPPWRSCADALDDVRRLFDEHRYGFDEPNDLQIAVVTLLENLCDIGIVIIEAPMGCGKTELALAICELLAARTECSGIFFALPTQATSNGIFPRMRRWAGAVSREAGETHVIRLVHSAAHLNSEYRGLFATSSTDVSIADDNGVIVHEWFEGRKKALLADFVVGTIDQLLMAGLKQRHLMLRHIALAGKVVIIDECHAYDTYMETYLETVLSWLRAYGIPVIVLSATLPSERRRGLLSAYMGKKALKNHSSLDDTVYPSVTISSADKIYRHALTWNQLPKTVEIHKLTYSDMIDTVRGIMKDGGCMGIVLNTVKAAQELAKALVAAYPQRDIRLLHSHFILTERMESERRLMRAIGRSAKDERPEWCIVVGTQVIEQSLDIDFDVLMTEICPMDLLLQRIGRLHRHISNARPAGMKTPRCYVIGAAGELTDANSAVYDAYLLQMTQRELPKEVVLPKDIAALVETVYRPCDEADELFEQYKAYMERRKKQYTSAQGFLLGKPGGSTLDDLQYRPAEGTEQDAEAMVRDTKASLEVLAFWRDGNEILRFFSDDTPVPDSLDEQSAARIAGERLRLPAVLCADYPGAKHPSLCLIEALERKTAKAVPLWQSSWMLKRELLLEFDAEKTTCLNGYIVRYEKIFGLSYIKH